MSFTSLTFLFLFFPLAMIIHFVTPKKAKNTVLLLMSLFFYSWGNPKYLILILISIVVTWFGVNRMDRYRDNKEEARFNMVCIIVINVAILAFFKYYGFFIENINAILRTNFKIIELPLPFGISFYTFKVISYIADVYTGKTKRQSSFIDLALYISMFPQIGAGPIVQYNQTYTELKNRTITPEKFGIGMEKFIIGLAKKVLLANNLAITWAQVKAMPGLEMSAVTAWIGIISFTLQIYFDFSGYSDIAIGIGYMMGFKWAENFNYPYISKSATEFWRRWHISLGNWFKTYVYFPLGGSKCSKKKHLRNIFVVWMMTGLWHGARWNFVIWGLYFGFLIYFEKTKLLSLLEKRSPKLQTLYCLLIVVIGWVMFDVDGVSNIMKYYGNMFIIGANHIIDPTAVYLIKTTWKLLLIAVIGSSTLVIRVINNIKSRFGIGGYIAVSVFYAIIFILSIASLVGESYSPFLYFNF